MCEPVDDIDRTLPPAFYAQPAILRRRALKDWWTLLHPPYTLWHLSYVVIGGCLIGPVDTARLLATLIAFFLAVGIAAHALDELHGRPLRTAIPTPVLITAAAVGLSGAATLGFVGVHRVGGPLVAFIAVGVTLAVAYNLELCHGLFHTNLVFALGWGAFPVLTSYYAQHERLTISAVAAAAFAYLLALAQRHLSTQARALRRHTRHINGSITSQDGTTTPITASTLLQPIELALRALTATTIALATTLVIARTHH